MRTLIIGKGQVGQALFKVLKNNHEVFIKDVEDLELKNIDVLNICYPDHFDFEKTTKDYIERYDPVLTIINSSVSVGTTDKCGDHVVYSPVRGRHPKLSSDLLRFDKYVFGRDESDVKTAVQFFKLAGMKVVSNDNPAAGEMLKLISNVHMGLEIAWRQEVERMLREFNIDPASYHQWEISYQEGYIKSGDNHLIRPTMRPDQIGGHCILPCTDILQGQFKSALFEFIKESNERAINERTLSEAIK